MSVVKRKSYSIEEKKIIINASKKYPNLSKADLAKKFNISVNSLKTILNSATKIKDSESLNEAAKKIRNGKYKNIEDILLVWFNEIVTSNIPISGPILREKASQIALRLNIEFTPSNGWIDRFKTRCGLVYRNVNGENNSFCPVIAKKWIEKTLPNLTEGYELKDIYNADETGFFYSMLPDKTLPLNSDQIHRENVNKARFTALFCCNADGTDKLKPLVIGESKNPISFKNIKTLPCDYRNNASALMTSVIFEEYVNKLEIRMRKDKRKILLFIDNSSAHPKEIKGLKFVKIVFFPANCTSVLQPLNQGIIRISKVNFRKRVVIQLLSIFETHTYDKNKPPIISQLDALFFITSAWVLITPNSIENCFKKSGFNPSEGSHLEPENVSLEENKLNQSIEECLFNQKWSMVQEKMGFQGSFTDYVSVDEKLQTTNVPSINLLCDDFLLKNEPEDNILGDEEFPIPTYSEAMEHFNKFRKYILSFESVPDSVIQSLTDIENKTIKLHDKSLMQAKSLSK